MKLRWKTDWEREGNVIIGVKMETAQKKNPPKTGINKSCDAAVVLLCLSRAL